MTDSSPHDPLFSRRAFTAASLTAFGTALQGSRACSHSPLSRVQVGIIGLGSRGFNLIDEFLRQNDCQITAVCDVDELHYRDRPWRTGKSYGRQAAKEHIDRAYAADTKSGSVRRGLHVFSDYRRLIEEADVDAVVVATPDHWHALCTLAAIRAGKDVYCEKPVTHLFAEGQAVVAATAKHEAVFQTGSQQRSDRLFQRVVELAHNDVLGEIQSVAVGLPPGYAKPMGSTDRISPRDGLDYEFWCGPSPQLPLMQARFHRWWRGHRAFGGGVLMDWIGHHNDIAHWAIGAERSGPRKVEAVNWTFPDTDVYDTPEQYSIRCEYEGGIVSTISSANPQGLKITGSEGWVYARRGKIEASDKRWLAKDFQPGDTHIPKPSNHVRNFLDNIRSRGECIAPAAIAHRSITPGHLGYVSNALNQPLIWDAEKEVVVGNDAADHLLKQIEYRPPWVLPAG